MSRRSGTIVYASTATQRRRYNPPHQWDGFWSLRVFRHRDSGLVLRRCRKASRGRSQGITGCSRFHEVHSTKDLPPAVIALCGGDKGRLADPGQNWNATDAVTDPTLPWKRLIFAAVGSDYYVVHYERGGIDHSFHILVAKVTKNDAKPTMVWRAVGHQLKDYAAFLEALRTGKLDDRLDYPH